MHTTIMQLNHNVSHKFDDPEVLSVMLEEIGGGEASTM